MYIPALAHVGTEVMHSSYAPAMVMKYQKRISGPLLERINIHIEVPRVDNEKLRRDRTGEMPESICVRVQPSRRYQRKQFSNNSSFDIICKPDMWMREDRAIFQVVGYWENVNKDGIE